MSSASHAVALPRTWRLRGARFGPRREERAGVIVGMTVVATGEFGAMLVLELHGGGGTTRVVVSPHVLKACGAHCARGTRIVVKGAREGDGLIATDIRPC